MTLAVNLFRIKDRFRDFSCTFAGGVKAAEEAAFVAGVAGGFADLLNLEDDGIVIAIDQDLFDDLDIAGAFTFVPELLAGAGKINGVTGFQSLLP